MKITIVKCPACGAALHVEEDKKQCFCQYCGTKLFLDDGSRQYEYREVDEARIREAEAQENIRSKEIELEKERMQQEQVAKDRVVKIIVTVAVIYLICYIIGGTAEWLAQTAIIWAGIVLVVRGLRKKK